MQQKILKMLHPNYIFLYLEKNIIKKIKTIFRYLVFIFDTKVQLDRFYSFNNNHARMELYDG